MTGVCTQTSSLAAVHKSDDRQGEMGRRKSWQEEKLKGQQREDRLERFKNQIELVRLDTRTEARPFFSKY